MEQEACILFVDYVAIRLFLDRQRNFLLSEESLGRDLMEATNRYGQLSNVYIFSDWLHSGGSESFEDLKMRLKATLPGRYCASKEMGRELTRMMLSDQLPRTVILVAGDKSYLPVIDQLRHNGLRVILWWFNENHQNDLPLIVNAADDFQSLDEIVTPQFDKRTFPLPREFALSAIVISLDNFMTIRDTDKLSYTDCLSYVENLSILNGEGKALLEGLIAEGSIKVLGHFQNNEREYSLNDLSTRVQKALELRDRLLVILDSILQGRKWVAFNHLERNLRGQEIFGYDEKDRRKWIEILMFEGLIIVEHKNNPDWPNLPATTALILNFDHPVVHQELLRNQLRRMIVIGDVFLTNRNYRWIAANTLMKLMVSFLPLGAIQRIFSYALDEAVITISKIPSIHDLNYTVSAVQLNGNNELVQQTVKMQKELLASLLAIYNDNHAGLTYSALLTSLSERHTHENRHTLSFWVDLLIRAGVVHRMGKSRNLGISLYTINKSLPIFALLTPENG